jgi:hypothetical protein
MKHLKSYLEYLNESKFDTNKLVNIISINQNENGDWIYLSNKFEKFEWTPEDQAFAELSDAERENFPYGSKPIKLNSAYHVTPLNNVQEILKNGLITKSTERNWEPKAVYMSKSIVGSVDIARQLYNVKKNFLTGHGVNQIKTDWVILKIDTKNLEIFRDPSSVEEKGVYTLQSIPPENIMPFHIIDYDIIKNGLNWFEFWNWWYRKRTDKKPNFVKKFSLPRPK